MIIVKKTFTATNADLLAGTDLNAIPEDGQLDIYQASSQNDWTETITGPGNEPVVNAQKIEQRTNGMVLLKDDLPISILVSQGGHYIVNTTVVTAGTGNLIVIYRRMSEL